MFLHLWKYWDKISLAKQSSRCIWSVFNVSRWSWSDITFKCPCNVRSMYVQYCSVCALYVRLNTFKIRVEKIWTVFKNSVFYPTKLRNQQVCSALIQRKQIINRDVQTVWKKFSRIKSNQSMRKFTKNCIYMDVPGIVRISYCSASYMVRFWSTNFLDICKHYQSFPSISHIVRLYQTL